MLADSRARKIMVYSPNTGGHRHIYCYKFINGLLQQNLNVVFVYAGIDTYSKMRRCYRPHVSAYLDALRSHASVQMVNVETALSEGGGDLKLMAELQGRYQVDATIIIDGDRLQGQLVRQILPWRQKLIGDHYAVFLFSEFMYANGMPPWRTFWQWLTHLVLFKHFKVLTGFIYCDENLVRTAGEAHYIHVPDIPSPPVPALNASATPDFYLTARKRLKSFLKTHKQKRVVVHLGDLEYRKGYDFLLRLVSEDPELVLIRAGRMKPGFYYDWDSLLNKEKLMLEQRLFEIDVYLEDAALIEMLYNAVDFIALPYRDFYRTSGGMLQAIMAGKPILAPNTGLINHRIAQHGLGRVYQNRSYASFRNAYYKMQAEYATYRDKLSAYAAVFSDECFSQFVGNLINKRTELLCCGDDAPGKVLSRQWTVGRLLFPGLKLKHGLGRRFWREAVKRLVLFNVRLRWLMITRLGAKNKRLVIFGGGQHTAWLEQVVSKFGEDDCVAAVLDDNPDAQASFWGHLPISPAKWTAEKGDMIILSSDVYVDAMRSRCRELFGQQVKLVNLYRWLPRGPYPK